MDYHSYSERPIIAVAGSAGKTTVKSMLAAILRERWVVFESKDYYNTPDKTELHAQQLAAIHLAAVLEYGMGYPGGITEHCGIIRPNIGIITNVGWAHIGNFEGDITRLAAAKAELIQGLSPSGGLLINADDQPSKLLQANQYPGKLITVGIVNQADYQATEIGLTAAGSSFKVSLKGQQYPFELPALGQHNVINALFAIAVADILGFAPTEIQTGLRKAMYPRRRLELYHLKQGITVIDDTVHAHPPAMQAALDVLSNFPGVKRIAVLGSMPALGVLTEQAHLEIGRYFASKQINALLTYGIVSELIGKEAIDRGFPSEQVTHFTPLYRRVMHRQLLKLIKPSTTVLVKGASRQNMYETVRFLSGYYGFNRSR